MPPAGINAHRFTSYDWKFVDNLDFLGLDSTVENILKKFPQALYIPLAVVQLVENAVFGRFWREIE